MHKNIRGSQECVAPHAYLSLASPGRKGACPFCALRAAKLRQFHILCKFTLEIFGGLSDSYNLCTIKTLLNLKIMV